MAWYRLGDQVKKWAFLAVLCIADLLVLRKTENERAL